MSQNQLKVQEKHKVGKRRPPDTDFWQFLMICGVPRGGQKLAKMQKRPSKHRSKKRRQKRRRRHPLLVECGGLRAASRNARFLLRKVFAMISWCGLQTPPLPAECGGFFSLTRSPPTRGIESLKSITTDCFPKKIQTPRMVDF